MSDTKPGFDKNLYKHLYQKINMSGPGMDDMPSQAAPGASMAQQARAAGYQDIYRNIQAMRDADYKKEVARGEITSEFSGLKRKARGLGGYLGQAAEKTAPGLMVALGLVIAYFLFFKKDKNKEESEAPEELFIEEEIEPASRYYF